MSSDRELLNQLRGVFRGELADHLDTLERIAVSLGRTELSPANLREWVTDAYRAAHSLKGAARAVGFEDVEEWCHGLEERLAGYREKATVADAGSLRESIAALASRLREWERTTYATRTEPTASDKPTRVRTSDTLSPDTVRVAVDRIAAIQAASEASLAAAAHGRSMVTTLGTFAEKLGHIRLQLDGARREMARSSDVSESIDNALATALSLSVWAQEEQRQQRATWFGITRSIRTLSQEVRSLQLARLDTLATVLERAALDTAAQLGKQVRFEMHGGELEVDRRVVDNLRDPLLHLVRNAVDHGIEPARDRAMVGKPAAGVIAVRALSQGTELQIAVTDDGGGLDVDAIRQRAQAAGKQLATERIIFETGFSTRAEATSTSGRGLGLDIVRRRIGALGGSIDVHSQPGRGLQVTMLVPGDLSALRGLVVDVRGHRFALGQSGVERVVRLAPSDQHTIEGRRFAIIAGERVPIADLAITLGLATGERHTTGIRSAVVVNSGRHRVGFLVDQLVDSTEVVMRPLGVRIRRVPFVTGVTFAAGGQDVVCVLDSRELARVGQALRGLDESTKRTTPARPILVVDDSVTTRQLLRTILQAAGYEVDVAEDGASAWTRLASSDRYALVVSDIEMPSMDGFQLLERVRSSPRTSRLPVVLVTALAAEADRRRAVELGADAYIVKGRFDQSALLEAVEELLP